MLVVSTHPSDKRHTDALQRALSDIERPDWAVVFGDRRDMLEAVLDLHYKGIKLIHIGGGDTPHGTEGHPDHRTRDAISMLASVHCVSNYYAHGNLHNMGIFSNVFVTGSPGLDEVVAYAKTLDPNRVRSGVFEWFPEQRGADGKWQPSAQGLHQRMPQEQFLLCLARCEWFHTNSSAGLYEAGILGAKTVLYGDRQKGRAPIGTTFHHPKGKACKAIRKIILEVCK